MELRAKIADELRRNDRCGDASLSEEEIYADADAIVRIVRDHEAEGRGWRQEDRASIDELVATVRHARDGAHWLAVHRRMGLARHMEQALDLVLGLGYDLQGRHARRESL